MGKKIVRGNCPGNVQGEMSYTLHNEDGGRKNPHRSVQTPAATISRPRETVWSNRMQENIQADWAPSWTPMEELAHPLPSGEGSLKDNENPVPALGLSNFAATLLLATENPAYATAAYKLPIPNIIIVNLPLNKQQLYSPIIWQQLINSNSR